MAQDILKTLEDRGIDVPRHHADMLINQWAAFQKLRATVNQEELADYDIGLTHVPGGDGK